MDWKDQLETVINKVGEEEAARLIGVSVRSFSNYRSGSSRPFKNTQRTIEQVYEKVSGNVSRETSKTSQPTTLDSLAASTAKLSESNLLNARNIDRLITLLENQQASSASSAHGEMQEVHSAKLYALEEYCMALGQKVNGTDRKTESVVLGKLEGAGFRLGEGIYTIGSESGRTTRIPEKTEKGSAGGSDSSSVGS